MARRLALSLALLCLAACSRAPADEAGVVAVRVAGLVLDDAADTPVVVLEEVDGERRLPIWIGLPEAQSIAAGLGEEVPLRPNSHDLSKRLIEGLDGRIERVVVTALRDGIYFARIDLARRAHDRGRCAAERCDRDRAAARGALVRRRGVVRDVGIRRTTEGSRGPRAGTEAASDGAEPLIRLGKVPTELAPRSKRSSG